MATHNTTRHQVAKTVTIAEAASESSVFDAREYAGFMMRVPNGLEGVIAFKAASNANDTFALVYDQSVAVITHDPSGLSADAWLVVHPEVFPAHFLKICTYTDDTVASAQVQASARAIEIMGKS